MNTYPAIYNTLEIDAAQLRHTNRTEITVLMCEQKSNPVWFLCRHEF